MPPRTHLHRLASAAALALLCVLPVPLAALDGSRQITQYGHDTWNFQNGLPGGAVYGIWQLSDGYLWIRQPGGLLRFDGVRFTPMPLEIGGRPVDEDVRSMAMTPDRRLVLRGPTRTFILSDGAFSEPDPPTPRRDGNDRVVLLARDGTLWLGADSSIYRIRRGNLEPVVSGTGWVSALIQDRAGRIWIGAGTGLYCVEDDKLILYPSGYNETVAVATLPQTMVKGGQRLTTSVTALLEDRNGTVWVGSHDGVHQLVGGELRRPAGAERLEQLQVTALTEDRNGNVWLGTDGAGLFRVSGGVWARYANVDGLSDDGICSLAEDDEGSLWIGTRSGLDRLRDTPLVTISAREGLSHDVATALTEGAHGSLFVYTYGGGITILDHGVFSYLNRSGGLGSDYAAAMHIGRDGTLWAGAPEGLRSYKDGRFTPHPDGGVLEQSYISSIQETDDGIVLGTSQMRLFCFKDGRYRPYDVGVPPGRGPASARYVYAMHQDSEGTLWIAMTAGLWRIPRGTRPEEAKPTPYLKPAHSLYDDGKGFLWVTGPETRGVARLRKSDGKIVVYGPEAGVPPGNVSRVITDRQGNPWFGTSSGIVTFSRADADLFAEGKIQQVRVRRFGVPDGLKTEECAATDQQPAALPARDGRLYFSTPKGVVVVDPEAITVNQRVPPVVMEEFVVDGRVQPRGSRLELPPGSNALEIHYSALSFLVPSRVRFRYQLEGYDSEWIDAGTRRAAYFTALRPGDYRFRVAACNDAGIWNETGASISFRLQPHVYQTAWFYCACAAALAAAAYGLHRIRVRRLRTREAELIATVEERTASLRDEITEHTEARRELQKYRAYLEQLVAERTAALQTSNAQLQREISERRLGEERYRRFFEEDLAGAFIATPSGRLVTYNPAFARIFELDSDPVQAMAELAPLFPTPAHCAELMQRLRAGGRVQDEEFEMKNSKGRVLVVLATVVGSFSPGGGLLEIKGYVVDNTERRRLEMQLRQSQKMEAIGQLAGGIAHDFNNLLTAIIGCSDCILLDPSDADEVKRLARDVHEAGQRAAALTRQLLAFSRKQVLQPKILSLNEVLAEMQAMLRRLIGEDIRLDLRPSTSLMNVRADPGQMQQIVLNLSVNARDAMPQGGTLTISTSNVKLTEPEVQNNLSVPPGQYVCLAVTDSGCGMNPEVQAHLFEPFFTTKGLGKGTGLGLSTVYGIVQQTNGYILCLSTEGHGSTFRIFLPVADGQAVPEAKPGTPAPFPRRGERVLLVEDNELVLSAALRCLTQFGYEVVDAPNGQVALERFRAAGGRFDLVVTDVVMPEMNGRELAEKIRKDYPGIKVLFMSGYVNDALGRLGDMANTGFLEKPFTPQSLLNRVRGVLDGPMPGPLPGRN